MKKDWKKLPTAMKNKESIFRALEHAAAGFFAVFPKNLEIVLHDLTEPSQSIRHISGNVTGRKVGDAVTDLIIKALHREGNNVRDRYNYKTTSRDGRTLKSSTIFIRDDDGDVIGALCINFDTTDYKNAAHALEIFANISSETGIQEKYETFTGSITETIETIFHQVEAKIGRESATMSRAERIDAIKELKENGVFKIKGSIDQVALLMGISKYTIYNYLKIVQTEKEMQRF